MTTLQISNKNGSYLIHGFVFVDEDRQMYGVRELSSREGRVLYGIPNREHFSQFGLQLENINNTKIAAELEIKKTRKLKFENERLTRLEAAILVGEWGNPFGSLIEINNKIAKCLVKIESLKE